MERLKNTEVVQKAELYYEHRGVAYCVGTISKEFLLDRLFFAYVFDINKDTVEKLRSLDKTIDYGFIPGIELDEYGYYQAFSQLPFFIQMRVIDRRREDVDVYLKKYDMEEYDAFTLMLRSEGRSEDNFFVKEVNI